MRVKDSYQAARGIYLLVILLPEQQNITVGSLGRIHFEQGYYAYVGSALGGFKSRLNRHLRKEKTPKWYIDYLLPHTEKGHVDNKLQKASLKSIIICETEERVECVIARAMRHQFESIPRFGSSDCKCPSHLFYAADENRLREAINAITASLSLNGRVIE